MGKQSQVIEKYLNTHVFLGFIGIMYYLATRSIFCNEFEQWYRIFYGKAGMCYITPKSGKIFSYQQFTCNLGCVGIMLTLATWLFFFCENKTYYFWWHLLRSSISRIFLPMLKFPIGHTEAMNVLAMRLFFSYKEFLQKFIL